MSVKTHLLMCWLRLHALLSRKGVLASWRLICSSVFSCFSAFLLLCLFCRLFTTLIWTGSRTTISAWSDWSVHSYRSFVFMSQHKHIDIYMYWVNMLVEKCVGMSMAFGFPFNSLDCIFAISNVPVGHVVSVIIRVVYVSLYVDCVHVHVNKCHHLRKYTPSSVWFCGSLLVFACWFPFSVFRFPVSGLWSATVLNAATNVLTIRTINELTEHFFRLFVQWIDVRLVVIQIANCSQLRMPFFT